MYDGWDTRSESKLNQIHSKLDTPNKINSAKKANTNNNARRYNKEDKEILYRYKEHILYKDSKETNP